MLVLGSDKNTTTRWPKSTSRTVNLATYRFYRPQPQPSTCPHRSFSLFINVTYKRCSFSTLFFSLCLFCSSPSVVHPRAWTRTPDVHINFGAPISSFIYFNTAPVWVNLLCERRDSPTTQKKYRLRMGPAFSLSAQFMSYGSKNQIRLRLRRLYIKKLILCVGLICRKNKKNITYSTCNFVPRNFGEHSQNVQRVFT